MHQLAAIDSIRFFSMRAHFLRMLQKCGDPGKRQHKVQYMSIINKIWATYWNNRHINV